MAMDKVAEILTYWFGDCPDDLLVLEQKRALWFGKDEQLDRDIAARFGAWVVAATQQELVLGNGSSSRRCLATIILLDQFTRNIYRADARAFASDELALQLALDALSAGYDRQLRPIERVFIYLPLEHAEQLELQERSVGLFKKLSQDVPEPMRPAFAGFLDYAVRHRDIIARFGRFPHRNKILGRVSSAEESEFLKQPNSSF